MKQTSLKNLFLLVFLGVFIFSGCKQPKKEIKTLDNLKAGYIGESTASAKYAAFALKATEEGQMTIAKLFEATSKAEAIHAANHKKVLEEAGVIVEDFKPEFVVKSTLENLTAAVEGETYEIDSMYPKFLADAKIDNMENATKSFIWAMETEKKHQQFYVSAIQAIRINKTGSLPIGYAVCPVCGNTYDGNSIDNNCAFCQVSSDKFILI